MSIYGDDVYGADLYGIGEGNGNGNGAVSMCALADILDHMADQIRTTVSVSEWSFQVEPRMVINPTPPTIDIYPGDPARDEETAAFGEMAGGHWINVRARVGVNDHVANQEVLLTLKDDAHEICLVQSLYDDPTLGGCVNDLQLANESGFVLTEGLNSEVHIGVIWRFLVLPAHS